MVDLKGAGFVSTVYLAGEDLLNWRTEDLFASAFAVGLEGLGFMASPLTTLVSSGYGWLFEHLGPLNGVLDTFVGEPAVISKAAAMWGEEMPNAIADIARHYQTSVDNSALEWEGCGAESYRDLASYVQEALKGLAASCGATSHAIQESGVAVSTARAVIRGLICDLLAEATVAAAAALATAWASAGSTMAIFWAWLKKQVAMTMRNCIDAINTLVSGLSNCLRLLSGLSDNVASLADSLDELSSGMDEWTSSLDDVIERGGQTDILQRKADEYLQKSVDAYASRVDQYVGRVGDRVAPYADDVDQYVGRVGDRAAPYADDVDQYADAYINKVDAYGDVLDEKIDEVINDTNFDTGSKFDEAVESKAESWDRSVLDRNLSDRASERVPDGVKEPIPDGARERIYDGTQRIGGKVSDAIDYADERLMGYSEYVSSDGPLWSDTLRHAGTQYLNVQKTEWMKEAAADQKTQAAADKYYRDESQTGGNRP